MLLQQKALSQKHAVMRPGIWRLGIECCSVLLSFGSTVLIARTLGPALFGSYSFALWLASVAAPAIGVGMSALTSRHVAEIQSREKPRLAAGIFYFVWRRQYRKNLVYCLLYLLLIWPFSWLFGSKTPVMLLLLAGLSVPPLLLSGVVGITLRSLQRFDLLAGIRLLGALITLFFLLISTQYAYAGEELVNLLLLASAAASILVLALALICLIRLLPLERALEPGLLLRERLTRGLNNSLLLFALDAIVWQRSELILLGRWGSAADLGFYSLSSIISTRIMLFVPTLLSTCILPLLLRYVPGQHYINADDAYRKTTRCMFFLALPICGLAFLFCPAIISSCFGPAYLPLVTPLRILLLPAAIGSISTVSLTYLVNGERRRAQVWLGTGSAALNILLAPPLIARWGIIGAALASVAAQIISATGSMIICKRYMRSRKLL